MSTTIIVIEDKLAKIVIIFLFNFFTNIIIND